MGNKLSDLSYSVYSNKGIYALLLGSGVSRPAGIPTGWEIVIDLIRQIAVLEKQKISEKPDVWFKDYFGEEPDYSNILEKLTSTPEERVNVLRNYFEPLGHEDETNLKRPTRAHQRIAQLVQGGFIKVIVTTNFDRLMENALKDLGIEPTVISNPSHIDNTMPLIHNKVTVVKIHGDYLDTNFLNIKSELTQYDSRINDLLKFIFENFGLITCGWSGKWDIALLDVLKESNKFRFGNYFLHTNKPTEEIEMLSNHRRGSLLRIKDADNLFKELAESVEALEKFNGENPLSAKIILARTKKYLAKEEHLISLADLIYASIEDVYKRLNTIELPYPTNDSVKEAINAHINITEEVIPILIEGGYWSKPYHQIVWTNAIKRIGSPMDNRSSSYTIWTQVPLIPLILARYAFGLASLAAGNWNALKASLEIGFRTKYDRELQSIIRITHVWRIMDGRQLNAALGKNYHAPMSELLFIMLRKYFQQILPNDDDFADTFDYYEFICCLVFLKEPGNQNDYPPTGRFGWRDRRVITSKANEFSLQSESFELVKAGLLTKDEMKAGIVKVEEVLKNERYR